MFLVGSRSYSVIIGGSDTINGVSGRFRYKLPYLRMFLEGSRSYNVSTGGSHPGASGIMRVPGESVLALHRSEGGEDLLQRGGRQGVLEDPQALLLRVYLAGAFDSSCGI